MYVIAFASHLSKHALKFYKSNTANIKIIFNNSTHSTKYFKEMYEISCGMYEMESWPMHQGLDNQHVDFINTILFRFKLYVYKLLTYD